MNLTGKRRLAVSDVKSKTATSEMFKSVGRGLGMSETESIFMFNCKVLPKRE